MQHQSKIISGGKLNINLLSFSIFRELLGLSLYSNYMQTVKTLLNIVVKIAEVVLQHRIDIRPSFLQRCSDNFLKLENILQAENETPSE